jgi:SAM-dependent methyltransferase
MPPSVGTGTMTFSALLRRVIETVRRSSTSAPRKSLGALGRSVFRALPRPLQQWTQQLRGKSNWIPIGSVRFGDFKRLSPISDFFGFERGTPIDRYYIEAFLGRNASDIRGRVLEIGGNSYTLRFGANRVDRSDILHVDESNLQATFVGDLAQPGVLPPETFDCIVFTQVLQFIFDFQGALRTLHGALRPGGVLLLTTPGVSKMLDAWPWYWNFTPAAIDRLLQNEFGTDSSSLEAHGNVFAAAAFLQGVAAEELDESSLEAADKNYAVVVAARVIKRKDA